MKMVMITYNEAMDEEVMELINSCDVKGYTKSTGVFGMGVASGTHRGDDIWPGLNNILYVACEQDQAKRILSGVMQLRKTYAKEGLKAFILPIEELT